MELHKSNYSTIRLTNNGLVLEHIWDSAEKMTSAEFKKEQLQLKYFLGKFKPRLIYTDSFRLKFVINIRLQEWNVDNVLNYFSAVGGEKIAVLLSNDFISSLSIEQALEEESLDHVSFQTQFFDNESQAKEWLLEKSTISSY